jgi:hypothetical protein
LSGEIAGATGAHVVWLPGLAPATGVHAGHWHWSTGVKMPGATDVLHVVLTGLVPPLTQTGLVLPSMRQPSPQQYVSF